MTRCSCNRPLPVSLEPHPGYGFLVFQRVLLAVVRKRIADIEIGEERFDGCLHGASTCNQKVFRAISDSPPAWRPP